MGKPSLRSIDTPLADSLRCNQPEFFQFREPVIHRRRLAFRTSAQLRSRCRTLKVQELQRRQKQLAQFTPAGSVAMAALDLHMDILSILFT